MSDDERWLEYGRQKGLIGGPSSQIKPPYLSNVGVIQNSNKAPTMATNVGDIQNSNTVPTMTNNGLDFFMTNPYQVLSQSPLYSQYQNYIERDSRMQSSPDLVISDSSQNSNPLGDSQSEDGVVTSPKKKRKAGNGSGKTKEMPKCKGTLGYEEHGAESKGSPNKRWPPECSDYAIEVLSEMAKNGLKVDKSFKRQAFVSCATAVNKRFNESFSPENVSNHLRTLKTKWNHYCFIRNLSGAGFDDEHKIIILDGKPLEDFKSSHPNLICYVNKPLKLYESLRLVAGDDQATGSYKKGVYQQFGPVIDLEIDGVTTPHAPSVTSGPSRGTNSNALPTMNENSINSHSSTKSASGKKRSAEDVAIDHLIEKVGEMNSVLATAQKEKTNEKLSAAVYTFTEFDVEILDKVFAFLYNDRHECGMFIAKPPHSRRLWMEKFKENDAGN